MFKIRLHPVEDRAYINYMIENNYTLSYEGCLLDNYIMEGDNIQYKDIKGNYGILLETYQNSNSSVYTLIITDNVAIYNKYYDIYLSDSDLEFIYNI